MLTIDDEMGRRFMQNEKDFGRKATMVVTGCGCATILGAILLPIFTQDHSASPYSRCITNIKTVGLGLQMYQQDYDGRFPRASEWMDTTLPYVLKDKRRYHCAALDESHANDFGHAFNSVLSLRALGKHESPEKVLMLYDANDLRWNANAPNRTGAANPPRHHGGDVFEYADGHAKMQTLTGQEE
jgi:hypothetical protein